jgi:N-acetylglucosaminylphosphatidylinositol deacetylase
MFFAPTIRGLLKGGWDVRGLCLSNGNAEGLGKVREGELRDAWEVLGVKGDKVEVLDLP